MPPIPLHSGCPPQSVGYKEEKVALEQLVDGITAAFIDPNYAKTITPKFYRTLREALKKDPVLRKLIQLNSLIATAGGCSAPGDESAG